MSNTKYPRHFMPDDYSLPTIEESKKYRGIFDKIYVEHEAISPHFPEALILLPRKGGYRIAPGSVPWLNGAKNDLLIDFFSDKNRKISSEFFFWSSFGKEDLEILWTSKLTLEALQAVPYFRIRDNVGLTSVDGHFSLASFLFFDISIIYSSVDELQKFDRFLTQKKFDMYSFDAALEDRSLGEDRRFWLRKYIIPLLSDKDS